MTRAHPKSLCQWTEDGLPCYTYREESTGNILHLFCPNHGAIALAKSQDWDPHTAKETRCTPTSCT